MKSNVKLKLKKGDSVIVITGDAKGNTGVIKSINIKSMRAIVEGVNMVKRHTKPSASNPDGGILEKEASIHISNLAFLENNIKTKIGRKVELKGDSKKSKKIVRYSKKTQNEI
jgi:large subunit ribosomal protein L24